MPTIEYMRTPALSEVHIMIIPLSSLYLGVRDIEAAPHRL
jgi:hypothetical protein